ncbi:MAG TPA: hypothetical protein VMZ53_05830 [Kofleriaceae bacterium]|nr:hypothetical protein [Kofleriaceae bacterium]
MRATLRPFVVVPASPDFARVFDRDIARIRSTERARELGVIVLMPRDVQPSTLMFAAYAWPQLLRGTGVTRIAVVLGIAAYAVAQPLLGGCVRRMADGGIHVEFMHEAHVESGALLAWSERRKPRRRVTTDQLVRVCERYADRGDLRSAMLALKLAEDSAELEDEADEPAEPPKPAQRTVRMRGSSEDIGGRITADLVA